MQTFPTGTPLTVLWHFTKPDGSPFSISGFTYKLFYRIGIGTTEVSSTMLSASGDVLAIVFPQDSFKKAGYYSFKLELFQNGSKFRVVNYNDAFCISPSIAPTDIEETQKSDEANIIHLYTASEWYLFSPIVPVVDGAKGYWVVNGIPVVDGSGNYVYADHSLAYNEEDNTLIIDKGRVDAEGHDISVVITSLADALSQAKSATEIAESVASHMPKIINGTWHVWSKSQNDYVDTGINATGPAGRDGSDAVTKENIENALGYTPVQPSDISAFITRSVSDLANYYLKSETYTKSEVEALIDAIQHFHYEIYPAQPATGESNVLYLIGPTGTGSDKYEEYVYVNNNFVKIGDTSIDLSGYVTTQALNAALADYTTTANLSQLLSQKENISNKTTILSEQSTDEQYPSAKLLYDMLFEKLVVPVNVISGGTIEDVIGANITVFDNDHNVTIATKEFQGDPLIFRIKAGINYTLSGENIDPFEPPVSVDYKSELDSIRNYTIKYFDSPEIKFVDPIVANICINTWGNGEVITEKMARAVTSLGNQFQGNTEIEAFDELRYFTSLSTINVSAFSGCSALETVNIPSSVTNIGNDAFLNTILNDVKLNLPNLVSIGIKAFYGTKITKIISLGSITALPQSVIGDSSRGVFQNCSLLTDVTLPETLKEIGINAFNDCTALTNVVVSNSLTKISEGAFEGCTSLSTIELPQTITYISGFTNSGLAIEINLPNLTTIGTVAFYNTKITKILSLGSITNIPDADNYSRGVFSNCYYLTDVIFPDTLTSIGSMAFAGCTNLQIELNLPNLTGTLHRAAFIGTKITKILSLGSITAIEDAFYSPGVFQNCATLTDAILPDTLTRIGSMAFAGCTALTTFVIKATVPPTLVDTNAIPNNTNLKIYVPYSANHTVLAEYQGATNWNAFASKMYELDENGNIPV